MGHGCEGRSCTGSVIIAISYRNMSAVPAGKTPKDEASVNHRVRGEWRNVNAVLEVL